MCKKIITLLRTLLSLLARFARSPEVFAPLHVIRIPINRQLPLVDVEGEIENLPIFHQKRTRRSSCHQFAAYDRAHLGVVVHMVETAVCAC